MSGYPTNSYEKIPGGTVCYQLSVMDPGGSFWVRCDKHKDYAVQVRHNYFAIDGFDAKGTIFDQAVGLLAQCPACISERPTEATRMCAQEEHDACGCAQ